MGVVLAHCLVRRMFDHAVGVADARVEQDTTSEATEPENPERELQSCPGARTRKTPIGPSQHQAGRADCLRSNPSFCESLKHTRAPGRSAPGAGCMPCFRFPTVLVYAACFCNNQQSAHSICQAAPVVRAPSWHGRWPGHTNTRPRELRSVMYHDVRHQQQRASRQQEQRRTPHSHGPSTGP